jgi:beta-1,2-mannosidase
LLSRPGKPFFKPEKPWEQSGQYAAGTTFAEGLVFFQDKWFLYYGCADSRVGVAVYDPTAQLKP